MGGGYAVYWYITFLNQYGIRPEYIVDSNSDKWGTNLYGVPVCSLEKAISKAKDYNIVIAAPKYREGIYQSLLNVYPEEKIFSFESEIYCTFIKDIQEYKQYLLSNWKRIEFLYDGLEDNLSRKTLIAFLKGRVSAEQKYFSEVMVPDQYYPEDIIQLHNDEVMVELGANDGNTLLGFLNKVNRQYKRVYCFEPDRNCIQTLKKVIAQENGDIELIERGAWDEISELTFYSDEEHGTSRVTEETVGTKECILLDMVDHCVNGDVTFIKMDIEGAELRALHGSEQKIQKYKPKLAICVYHKKEDLLDIAEYLRKLVPEYRLYLRHHNWGATETVLYAKV